MSVASKTVSNPQWPTITTTVTEQWFLPVTSESIQIHHTGQYHWVTSCSIGGNIPAAVWQQVQGRWFVFLTSGTARADLQDMHHKGGGWRGWLQVPWDQCSSSPVATRGLKDCGFFTIAFAYHAARGNNLSNIKFQQEKMRQHLAYCFKKKRLELFPYTTPHRQTFFSYIKIELYCDCVNNILVSGIIHSILDLPNYFNLVVVWTPSCMAIIISRTCTVKNWRLI